MDLTPSSAPVAAMEPYTSALPACEAFAVYHRGRNVIGECVPWSSAHDRALSKGRLEFGEILSVKDFPLTIILAVLQHRGDHVISHVDSSQLNLLL